MGYARNALTSCILSILKGFMVQRKETEMTPKQEKEYVEADGSICPFCGEHDINGVGPYDGVGTIITLLVECNDCGERWHDIYTLTGADPA